MLLTLVFALDVEITCSTLLTHSWREGSMKAYQTYQSNWLHTHSRQNTTIKVKQASSILINDINCVTTLPVHLNNAKTKNIRDNPSRPPDRSCKYKYKQCDFLIVWSGSSVVDRLHRDSFVHWNCSISYGNVIIIGD